MLNVKSQTPKTVAADIASDARLVTGG